MNWSHTELVQTLVTRKVRQHKKFGTGCSGDINQGIQGLDTMNKTMSDIAVPSFHKLKLLLLFK